MCSRKKDNIQILTIQSRCSIPGVWGSSVGVMFCVEFMFEVEKCPFLDADDEIKKMQCLIKFIVYFIVFEHNSAPRPNLGQNHSFQSPRPS